ncbi:MULTISPECIES: UDP-N-acetylmuramate:L-alanyl-gamma-D-glutamyl-meso-diaminopimelate ligase [Alcaligenes]|uniref:UDP-N-acetylmuramate:L-alanyl-gamma-D-glutamyl- meso-diaminopimelate ligase n=1 Tax=Alcaligenes TaxID=507 RepID=UPI000A2E82D3|nr:UDP-N-acetylmuramate:L-alanyl-gamma-D-glutamyl-meso-diaminopimelate ligase [Alcaligenes faecalis]MDK7584306.1 UDP-N-acetylmuramate:L-alanyl-gamma-D-glutamyl-meso-diaminopimelate ligase [Alcaligenes phenolicus]MBY6309692.1 UDP-N-acetylmuramate:L-alanyl-gamma-D-glutamyl-meso-diaminopimelate ligase [Alcaligenes faecalis]MBY6318489.1 UDP-N-acetylmuramate:L-alanyl-gamma-D-glutamyl-meso-diaminopimelate ligase [Alcaligenes faecalis]MBY6392571.1 UDP-N-acetylmuramate:L-alanyl-gamma-D-glutamyl-meso-di
MHIHILGICGTFMGGLALIARSAGHTVTGCDAGVYPPMSTQLEEQGIELIEGFGAEQTRLAPDLYIVGNVVTRGNPLMEAILDQGLPYTSGPQWLGENILHKQHVLAVAGTHGKTSTSSMLGWILEQADLSPNFLIGGVAPGLGVSARFNPEQSLFVIEADEYDTAFFDKRSKFVHYRPRTAILNNLEYDHADIFPDLHAIQTQFHHLVRTIPSTGLILRPTHTPSLDETLARGCWTPVEQFGPEGDWDSQAISPTSFEVLFKGQTQGTVQWTLTGEHNRLNALAAIAAAHHVGVKPEQACAALSQFAGIKRRMEVRGVVNGITVYDDFAHHPTAIATTLAGLRSQTGTATRILAVLEPRSNTMKLGAMAARLPGSLEDADLVFCYGETQGKHALGWDAAKVLAPLGDRATAWNDLDKMVQAIVQASQPGDAIVVMSNGSFGGIHQRLLDQLSR